jgi:shikimate dehydrogenase
LAVIGHPIAHSVSPQMHNAALAALALDDESFATWRYHPFDIEPPKLAAALGLLAEHGFRGVNLTVPHKVLAVALASDLDPGAAQAGAVNTLARHGEGWRGYNTDGYGLATAIQEDLGLSLRGSGVVLLGAGGAARGAAVQCLRSACSALWIVNRTAASRDALLEHLGPLARGTTLGALAPGARLPPGAILINATSAGLQADDPAPVDLGAFRGLAAVYDMVYNHRRTRLLEQARALQLAHANGLGMLVHQGAKALEIWTGIASRRTAPTMRAAAAAALGY